MIELHVTYTMKPGIRPKAFYDALDVYKRQTRYTRIAAVKKRLSLRSSGK